MFRFVSTRVILALTFVLVLAACQSSEDRAEEHYQSALRLIAEGDTDRAIVEFRNVFDLNGRHQEARSDFAALLRELGRTRNAYRQYLRLVEQYPDHVEGRIALTEIAISLQNWEEAQRHGTRAVELAPDDPASQVIAVNLAYAEAIEAEDATARRQAADEATAMLAADPGNLFLHRLLVDAAIRDGDFEGALAELDRTIAIDAENRTLYATRLGLLAQLGRQDELEGQLQEMIARFPGDAELVGTLLRLYIARGDTDQAQAFLREVIEDAEDETQRRDARGALVRLALETGGAEAALAELDTIIATAGDDATYRAMRASILFDQGEREVAIAEMETILEAEVPADEIGRLQVTLARMLMRAGNQVGARALVEEVLAADPSQVEALKMKAAWLIEEDETREAIALLRTALDGRPDDAEALTLSAQAHARNGDRDLAREFLSLAVEASNSAPAESLRYAEVLIAEERLLPAEEVLIAALRLSPGNLPLLSKLGEIYVRLEDWSRTEQVEEALRGLETPEGARVADGLQATRLASQGRLEDAIVFLEDLVSEGQGGDVTAQIAVVRARLANGDREGALNYALEALAAAPDNLALHYTLAALQSALGLYDDAIANYREILAREPATEQAWIDLIRAFFAQGDLEAAETALQDGLAAVPDGLNLLWAQASFREQQRDFDGAIELYELMYERAPNQPVVANNLASLLSTHREDAESLDRAYAIARRLRGTDFAPFQDTYGWIAYRRGDYAEALEHLEPAAAALPDDPLAQYHLGMAYVALDRPEDALTVLRRAVEVAGDEDPRPQFGTARAEIERLESEAAEAAETDE